MCYVPEDHATFVQYFISILLNFCVSTTVSVFQPRFCCFGCDFSGLTAVWVFWLRFLLQFQYFSLGFIVSAGVLDIVFATVLALVSAVISAAVSVIRSQFFRHFNF